MSGHSGRNLVIDRDNTTLKGVQQKGASFSADLVDTTNDDDNGFESFLDEAGRRRCQITVSGITNDEVLVGDLLVPGNLGKTMTVTLPTDLATAGTVSGTFMLESLDLNGGHDGAVEFSATFKSNGQFTYTASSA